MLSWIRLPAVAFPLVVVLLATPAISQERATTLQLSGGIFNVGKSPTQAEVGLELRSPTRWWRLDSAGGVAVTEEGSIWIHGGFRTDWNVSKKLVLSPGFGLALYEQGDGKDLGGAFQFRSSIDLGYRLTTKARVGLLFYHLSNAGLRSVNPGANSAVVTYSVRLR